MAITKKRQWELLLRSETQYLYTNSFPYFWEIQLELTASPREVVLIINI